MAIKTFLGVPILFNAFFKGFLPHRHSQRLIGVGVQVLKVIFAVTLKRVFKGLFKGFLSFLKTFLEGFLSFFKACFRGSYCFF